MKRWIAAALCLLMVLGLLAGCANQPGGKKLSIVTTIFPEYDWVREIVGENTENVEITLLQDNGADLHNYQPTTDDIIKISTCDLFIHVGGESDQWVSDAMKTATNKNMVVINLLNALGSAVKEEERVEGMQGEEEEEGEEGEEEEPEYDEHVWLSLTNSAALCRVIAEKLGELDPAGKESYAANANAYIEKLTALDVQYRSMINAAPIKTVLFGDRFPFRYWVDDYNLNYYAAFVGCSAETEASFETVIFLAGKVDELGLHTILCLDGSDGSIARTIKENSKTKDQQILTVNSLQSITAKDVADGVTYLSIMEENLKTFSEALK